MGIYLGISLFLIFIQPDFGTVLIILLTLMCMALFAGLDPRFIIGVLIFGILVIVIALVAGAIPYGAYSGCLEPLGRRVW